MKTNNSICSGNSLYAVLSAEAIQSSTNINAGVLSLKDVANLQCLRELGYTNITMDDLAATFDVISKANFIFMRNSFAVRIQLKNDLQLGDLCKN